MTDYKTRPGTRLAVLAMITAVLGGTPTGDIRGSMRVVRRREKAADRDRRATVMLAKAQAKRDRKNAKRARVV